MAVISPVIALFLLCLCLCQLDYKAYAFSPQGNALTSKIQQKSNLKPQSVFPTTSSLIQRARSLSPPTSSTSLNLFKSLFGPKKTASASHILVKGPNGKEFLNSLKKVRVFFFFLFFFVYKFCLFDFKVILHYKQ